MNQVILNQITLESLNWWQHQEVSYALRHGEKLIRHDQFGTPSYFTIEGPNGSRPFKFSVSFRQTMMGVNVGDV